MIKRSFSVLLFLLFILQAFSQPEMVSAEKADHFSLAAGTGWSHYFNNLEYGDKNMVADNIGVSLRFFWETEYLLGLGFESGYYRLFSVRGELTQGGTGRAERGVIPLMMLVRMRIIDHLYLGTGLGYALVTNKFSEAGEPVKTTTLSLSNYQASVSYIFPMSKHFRMGGEMQLNNYGGLNDWMYSLQILCAIRF